MTTATSYAVAEHILNLEGLGPAHDYLKAGADEQFVADRIESLLSLDIEDDGANGETDLAAGCVSNVDRIEDDVVVVTVGDRRFEITVTPIVGEPI